MTTPAPPPPDPRAPTAETVVQPPGRRVVVDEGPPPAPVRPYPWWLWGLVALCLAAAVVFLVLWLMQRNDGKDVPALVGVRLAKAQDRATARGFTLKVVRQTRGGVPGMVVDQAPQAGASLEKGAQVMAVVSAGRGRVTVPALAGQQAANAEQLLTTLGLQSRKTTIQSKQPKGTVVSQDPKPGQQRPRGSTVAIVVSTGAAAVRVPSLQGMSQADAVNAIQNAGFVPIVIQVPSKQPQGTVIAQDPAADQQVRSGSKIRVNVSGGPANTSTQTLTVTTSQTTTTAATTTVSVTTTP